MTIHLDRPAWQQHAACHDGGLTYEGAVIHTWMTVDIKTPFPEVAV